MTHADIYCKTLDQLDRGAAINAIHHALMQLRAQVRGVENLDHQPTIELLKEQLRVAGHPGFQPQPEPEFLPDIAIFSTRPDGYAVVVRTWFDGSSYGCLLIDEDGNCEHDDCHPGWVPGLRLTWDELPPAVQKTIRREIGARSAVTS